jgi:hypothetical protein
MAGDDEVVRTSLRLCAVAAIGRTPGTGVGPTNFVVCGKGNSVTRAQQCVGSIQPPGIRCDGLNRIGDLHSGRV